MLQQVVVSGISQTFLFVRVRGAVPPFVLPPAAVCLPRGCPEAPLAAFLVSLFAENGAR